MKILTEILHICGVGRSGSTLLEIILANNPNAIALGATRMLWKFGFQENVRLPTGESFLENSLWAELNANMESGEAAHIRELIDKFVRTKSLPELALRLKFRSEASDFGWLRQRLSRFYADILAITGKRYIIDSTSASGFTLLLNSIPSTNVKNFHLIRHPRAVSYSWQNSKPKPEFGEQRNMAVRPLWQSDRDWLLHNCLLASFEKAGLLQNRLVISYEGMCQNMSELIPAIETFTGDESFNALHDLGLSYVETYGVAGNPIRFNKGALKISLDERWKSAAAGKSHLLADAAYALFT